MEFALIIPVFLMLVAGMVDLGVGLISYMTIINAARDGARVGATACAETAPPCSSVVTTRVNAAAGGVPVSSVLVCTSPAGATTTCNAGGAKDGGSVTVRVSTTYHMIWPLAFGATIPMTASAKFLVP